MILQLATIENTAVIKAIDPLCVNDPLRSRMIERAVANAEAYLMLEGEELVGYSILTDHFFRQPFIEMLYVVPEHRRKGYGEQAIIYLERIASLTSNVIWTSTNQSNQAMRDLLPKLGYRFKGSLDVDPGDLEFFFRKDLRKL